jgi:hypothetical protein
MNRWNAEPFWQWWDTQLALIAQEQAPDPQLTAAVTEIARLMRGKELGAHRQQLGALRHGAKHWKRRR